MDAHTLVTVQQSRILEYLVAVTYLILFVPFWRYVNGGAAVREAARRTVPVGTAGWFELPAAHRLHPGHTWVSADDGTVAVGIDDFAQKLLGPLTGVDLPPEGTRLVQGEPAWRLAADGMEPVPMVAPVDGTVVTVNEDLIQDPTLANHDPYGRGWLLKLRPARREANARHLLSGRWAERWMDAVTDSLRDRMAPELGAVLQDGGVPVRGIARELNPTRPEDLARELLLTGGES